MRANAFKTEEYASNELKKYLCLSTGADLEITDKKDGKIFLIGDLAYEKGEEKIDLKSIDFNGDGFILKVTDNAISLCAKTGRGIIYGVYRFLEKYLGVRFFNSDCELVPKNENVILENGTFVEKPTFAMRSYLTGQLIMANPPQELKEYYLKLKQCNEHQHLSEDLGGECQMWGRGGTHNMHRYVPYDIYKDKHPEWYAFDEGLGYRTIDLQNGITEDGKLDESMEESVLKVAIEELKKDIIKNPNVDYFQFEQEDTDPYNKYEEGSKQAQTLAKYGNSGVMMRFCNVLATELQKWADKELDGRKIYIVTFAYAATQNPPVNKVDGKFVPIDDSVIAVDNLVIRMAMWANGAYTYFDEHQTELLDRVNGWGAVANKFMFWGYDTDFVSQMWYFPTMRFVKQNLLGMKKIGVIYSMFESADSSVYEWQTDLKAYMYANLTWNLDYKLSDLYNEYVDYFYQDAAPFVKKIVAIYENYSMIVREIYGEKYVVDTFNWSYRHHDLANEKLYERLLKIHAEAEQAIKNSALEDKALYLKRLAAIKVTILHMKINKVNDDLFKAIKTSGITKSTASTPIPENRGQTFYNVEMVWRVKEKMVIPDDIQAQIKAIDVDAISDELDMDKAW